MKLQRGDFIRTHGKSYEECERFFNAIVAAGCSAGEDMSHYHDWSFEGDVLAWDTDDTTYWIAGSVMEDRHLPTRDVTDMFFSEKESVKPTPSEDNMRVVVYYTDGSEYTNKNVEEVTCEAGKLYIKLDVAGTSVLDAKQIESGVLLNTAVTINSKVVEIDTDHVAGYCVMRKGGEGMWIKSYYPLKHTFSSSASVSGLKSHGSKGREMFVLGSGTGGKSLFNQYTYDILEGLLEEALQLPSEFMTTSRLPRVQDTGAGSGFSPELTLDTYAPTLNDYVDHTKLTLEEYEVFCDLVEDKFPSFSGQEPAERFIKWKYTHLNDLFDSQDQCGANGVTGAMERDVTHLFKGSSKKETPSEDTREFKHGDPLDWDNMPPVGTKVMFNGYRHGHEHWGYEEGEVYTIGENESDSKGIISPLVERDENGAWYGAPRNYDNSFDFTIYDPEEEGVVEDNLPPTEERVKATAGYTLADGSDSGEYYVGDKFVVTSSSIFSKGSVVSLWDDDTTDCPVFKVESGECTYYHCDGEAGTYEEWCNLTPLI